MRKKGKEVKDPAAIGAVLDQARWGPSACGRPAGAPCWCP